MEKGRAKFSPHQNLRLLERTSATRRQQNFRRRSKGRMLGWFYLQRHVDDVDNGVSPTSPPYVEQRCPDMI
uniref:Uncharacterized protein n=1 Tax=Cucumis sativus TaxID=3659 RepID=A0A0A0KTY8_CUCSA